jgi:hypothetical protein
MSHVTKPQIAANQNVESRIYSVNSWVVPELLAFMTRYQTVQLNSLGARFVSGMENTSGAIGILILTETRRALYTAPATRNHLWLNQNGCKITPCRSQANSPPSSDAMKVVVAATPATAANALGTQLGQAYWVFEGPVDAAARTHLGEIQFFVDAIFEGL